MNLKRLIGLGLGLTLCGLIGSGALVGRVDSAGDAQNDHPILAEIVSYGTLAANSHNAQMWKVWAASEREIVIGFDQARLLRQVDPLNREALISLGAFVENMAAMAPKYGLRAEVTAIADRVTEPEIVRVIFRDGPMQPDMAALEASILKRHTIRTPYFEQLLRDEDREALQSLDRQRIIYFGRESPAGNYLQHGLVESMRQQTANDPKQSELAEWIRFSPREAKTRQDGLTPEMMGISGPAKWFVSTFFKPETVMTPSFRKQTIAAMEKQVAGCSGFFAVTSRDDSVQALLEAGRLLQRFLNQAAALEVAVHPMSSILEESPWQEAIGDELGLDQKVQMVLRVGYVKHYGRPSSRRRPVEIHIP